MKIKFFIFLIIISLTLTSCSSGSEEAAGKINILCTAFPQYDWVKNITKDSPNVNVDLIIKNGIDIHSFQPSAEDIIKIYESDLFIFNGGNSEIWVYDALKDKNVESINISKSLGSYVLNEEIKEGMQAQNEEDEVDEHFWLSLKNAERVCDVILEKLCSLDPQNSQAYISNAEAYKNALSELDKEYEEINFEKPVVFADRFPFLYMANDYDIDYYAAFPGCSAETSASFETVIFLAEKINEYDIKSVGVTENSDKSIAQAVIDNTADKNQEIIVFDSMQSISTDEIENGRSYISIMKENLEAFKKTL